MIKDKKKKQYDGPPEFRSKVVLPYSADFETDSGETSDTVAEQQGFRCDASALKLHSFGLEVIMSSDY